MQTTVRFDLEQKIKEFESRVLSAPEVTPRDCQDLSVHLLDCMDAYKAKGLDEEEAFLLALNQVGDADSWEKGFKDANQGLIQIKRSIGLFGGVFFFFIMYWFVMVFDKTLLLIGGQLNIATTTLYLCSKYFLQGIYLATVLGIIVLVLRENWFLRLIGKINLRPKQIVLFFILMMVLAISDSLLNGIVKGLLKVDMRFFQMIDDIFVWFSYLYPIIFSCGFLAIYLRYFKDTKKE